jgi:hypothetical protein
MIGHEEKVIPEDDKRQWKFKYVERGFRLVLILEREGSPVGYINLDSEDAILLWQEVEQLYFK